MSNASKPTDDTIDLTHYLRLIAGKWTWLAIPAVLGILGAVIAGVLLPPSYEAVALVSIDQAADRPTDEALIEFALSDGIVQRTLDQLSKDAPIANGSLVELRSRLGVHYTRPLVVLSASAQDPVEAATIANQWAATFRNRINADLRAQPPSDDPHVRALDTATQNWRLAEMAWLASEAHPQVEQWQSLSGQISRRLAELGILNLRLELLERMGADLAERLTREGADLPASPETVSEFYGLADGLSGLVLSGASTGISDVGALLAGDAARGLANRDLIEAIDKLVASAGTRRKVIQTEITSLESQSASARADMIDVQIGLAELELQREVARRAVLDAARELGEQTQTGAGSPDLARVASQASPPATPRSPRPVRDGFLAGVAGLLIGFGALAFRDRREATPRGSEPQPMQRSP